MAAVKNKVSRWFKVPAMRAWVCGECKRYNPHRNRCCDRCGAMKVLPDSPSQKAKP